MQSGTGTVPDSSVFGNLAPGSYALQVQDAQWLSLQYNNNKLSPACYPSPFHSRSYSSQRM